MVKLFCATVGVAGSTFPVDIDTSQSVGDLKDAIKAKKMYQFPADELQLFLAKKNEGRGPWLTEEEAMSGVSDTTDLKLLRSARSEIGDVGLSERDVHHDLNKQEVAAGYGPVNVLVKLWTGIDITIKERIDRCTPVEIGELQHYREQGQLIQRECKDYCAGILDKIESHYTSGVLPLPFICVEGSSGMGKSQLAFALGGGRRPWFYWPATSIGLESQSLYQNFTSISATFNEITNKDEPMQKLEEFVLNSASQLYEQELLWTYGFIRALLEYCSLGAHQRPQMIRFEEETSFHVEKCNLDTVSAVRAKMVADGKVLPFFVLDEMSPNVNMDGGGKNMSAFQRNVFRACGLLVVVMGTDAKITNLVDQSGGSSGRHHLWVSIVSRFPPFCPIPFKDKTEKVTWDTVKRQYPVVEKIAVGSRGRFARHFMARVVEYASGHPSFELHDLLDEAFVHVSRDIQKGKKFMTKQDGMDAQLMAMSYTNISIELPTTTENDASQPTQKKRKIVGGVNCMHLHFANLVDDQFTDLELVQGALMAGQALWKPLCSFPRIEEDMLLYLAVLGGKEYSGYYDHTFGKAYSTKQIFMGYLKGKGFSMDQNSNAMKNDFMAFENMVAHMIFCASRRNGVQGTSFDDFFAGLLGEFQNEYRKMDMTLGSTTEVVLASELLEGYARLTMLAHMKIPFLAPPNAVWPKCILEIGDGCNFGHLVRAADKERCDLYVLNQEKNAVPLFLCECKHWATNVDMRAMRGIVGGLESKWEDKWTVVLLFCVKLASFRLSWPQTISERIGCVKIDCQSCHAEWVFQPVEGQRDKLIIVMETGALVTGAT